MRLSLFFTILLSLLFNSDMWGGEKQSARAYRPAAVVENWTTREYAGTREDNEFGIWGGRKVQIARYWVRQYVRVKVGDVLWFCEKVLEYPFGLWAGTPMREIDAPLQQSVGIAVESDKHGETLYLKDTTGYEHSFRVGTKYIVGKVGVADRESSMEGRSPAQLANETISIAVPNARGIDLPPAAIGRSYSASLEATGGVAPYVWSATRLPAGLVIDAKTGTVSGTPSVAATGGTYFTVRAVDAHAQFAERLFWLPVSGASSTPVVASRPELHEPPNPNGFPKVWRSLSSGLWKVVRIQGDRIYTETVLTPQAKSRGASQYGELTKTGDKYIGKEHVKSDCQYDGSPGRITNLCPTTWDVEITMLSTQRIEGRVRNLLPGQAFQCETCSYPSDAKLDWVPFAWIPDEPGASPSSRLH